MSRLPTISAVLSIAATLSGCGTLFPLEPGDAGDGDLDADADTDVDSDEEAEPLCRDGCLFALDGYCDDGGRGAMSAWCGFGEDCTDCGPRDPSCVPFCGPAGSTYPCGWDECGDFCGICPAGQFCRIAEHACNACSCEGAECGMDSCGTDCGTCPVGRRCEEWACVECSCSIAGVECGMDEERCVCGLCATGFCNQIDHTCDPAATPLCNDSCFYAGDGICDDHGTDCSFAACPFGSDCTDCGPRTEDQRLPADLPCGRTA